MLAAGVEANFDLSFPARGKLPLGEKSSGAASRALRLPQLEDPLAPIAKREGVGERRSGGDNAKIVGDRVKDNARARRRGRLCAVDLFGNELDAVASAGDGDGAEPEECDGHPEP